MVQSLMPGLRMMETPSLLHLAGEAQIDEEWLTGKYLMRCLQSTLLTGWRSSGDSFELRM